MQYPSGEHPMGIDVNHHHNHTQSANSHSNPSANANEDTQHGHPHGIIAFNATEPVPSSDQQPFYEWLGGSDQASVIADAEHEHSNHSHTPSHPPVEPLFVSTFFQTETLKDDEFTYINRRYAPPIPPPYTR